MTIFHKDMTAPKPDEVFVFGSNSAGIHGAGSARYAYDKLDAEWTMGHGIGPENRSYALPTKNFQIQSYSLDKVNGFVKIFVKFVKDNPDLKFFITRVGCGLAGFTDSEIAPMFSPLKNNPKVSFPEEWKPYL